LPKYFFDTSALAKVYREKMGSDFVDRVLSEPGSQHRISRLTIVELESVFALKVRTGEIDQHSVLIARRTLDALQVSVALGLKRAGLVTVFVAADQTLCPVAMLWKDLP
jgi:hypothetical protein